MLWALALVGSACFGRGRGDSSTSPEVKDQKVATAFVLEADSDIVISGR